MSHSTSAARTPTTLYLKPAYASRDSRPSDNRIDRLVERASRTASSEPPSLRQSALSRLARESFEAGFAAGAAHALADERSTDSARVLPNDTQSDTRPSTVAASDSAARAPSSNEPSSEPVPREPIRALSPRRFQVLELVARGLTNPEIASVLGISANTVKAHLTSILEILDVSNRTEAAMALQDYERRAGEHVR